MIVIEYGGADWRLSGYDPPSSGAFHSDPGEWECISFEGVVNDDEFIACFWDELDPGLMLDWETQQIIALPVDLCERMERAAQEIDEITSHTPDEFDYC